MTLSGQMACVYSPSYGLIWAKRFNKSFNDSNNDNDDNGTIINNSNNSNSNNNDSYKE